MSQDADSSMQSIVDSFSSFTRLNTLYIQSHRTAQQADSLYENILLESKAIKTASRFLQGIPTLNRIAFALSPTDGTLWYAKDGDVAMAGDIIVVSRTVVVSRVRRFLNFIKRR
jgi:hypothetical protein